MLLICGFFELTFFQCLEIDCNVPAITKKFSIFVFVPFAGWYVGKEIGISEYPSFISSLLMSSFVAPVSGIPFMLDLLKIPSETFNLFIVSSVFKEFSQVCTKLTSDV